MANYIAAQSAAGKKLNLEVTFFPLSIINTNPSLGTNKQNEMNQGRGT